MRTALIYAALLSLSAQATHAAEPKDNINNYLTDISAGNVSAAGLVGGIKSPITTIEDSQDLILAVQPLTSEESRKAGFGIAFTPAKSTLLPMAGSDYAADGARGHLARLAGNLTFSYAQNAVEIAGQNYRRSAYAINTVYYFSRDEDPVVVASKAFQGCANQSSQDNGAAIAAIVRADPPLDSTARQQALEALTEKRVPGLFACIDKKVAEVPWNSARASIGIGEGRIRADTGAASYSLGRSWNVNAQFPLSPKGLIQVSLRGTRNALDPDSLGKPAVSFKSSRLAAVRLTYGDQEATDLRLLIEGSNSKSASAAAYREAFVVAVGVDKKLMQGAWLELRFGRNRALNNGKEQNAVLLGLNIAPTLFAYRK